MSDYRSTDLRSAARFAAEDSSERWDTPTAADVAERPEVACGCEANGVEPDLDDEGICLYCEAMEAEDREYRAELRRMPW